MRVEVIVNSENWNRLEGCWVALGEQTFSEFRVVLNDYGINQSVIERAKSSRLYHEGRVLPVRVPGMTINQAWNQALSCIANSTTTPTYVGFLDEDSRPKSLWLQNLVSAADKSDDRVGMFASKVLAKCESRLRSTGHTLQGWGKPDRGYRRLVDQFPSGRPLCPCLTGALFRWHLIEEVRQPDEPFFDEDIEHYRSCFDLGIKARIFGWSCDVVTDAVVVDARFDAQSESPADDKQERLKQESRLALTLKYVPCEQLPEALINQLGGSTANMLKRGKGEILAKAFENLAGKRDGLLAKRSRWAQMAERNGTRVSILDETKDPLAESSQISVL